MNVIKVGVKRRMHEELVLNMNRYQTISPVSFRVRNLQNTTTIVFVITKRMPAVIRVESHQHWAGIQALIDW